MLLLIQICYFSHAEYAAYGPSLPVEIKVPHEFGKGVGLLLNGFMNDSSDNFQEPQIEFYDLEGELALQISLDPNFNTIEVWSPFNEVNQPRLIP